MSPSEEHDLRERIAAELEVEAAAYDALERESGWLTGSSAAGVMHQAADVVRRGRWLDLSAG